jgi:hypothetical protein
MSTSPMAENLLDIIFPAMYTSIPRQFQQPIYKNQNETKKNLPEEKKGKE